MYHGLDLIGGHRAKQIVYRVSDRYLIHPEHQAVKVANLLASVTQVARNQLPGTKPTQVHQQPGKENALQRIGNVGLNPRVIDYTKEFAG
jgi:hypothetical protein